MCRVIVLDAGRNRSTNLRDACIHDHRLGYRNNYLLFYQLHNSNLTTHHILFSREKPLATPPGSISHQIFSELYCYLCFQFVCLFYFIYILSKTQKYIAAFYLPLFYLHLSIYLFTYYFTQEGLTIPLCIGLRGLVVCVQVLFT